MSKAKVNEMQLHIEQLRKELKHCELWASMAKDSIDILQELIFDIQDTNYNNNFTEGK